MWELRSTKDHLLSTFTYYTNTLITTHLYLADKVQNSETSVYIFRQT